MHMTSKTVGRFIPFFQKDFLYLFSKQYKNVRNYSTTSEPIILGIESSCDDSAAAIVDGNGNILGEAIFSQTEYSTRLGGIIPTLSNRLHLENIGKSIKSVFSQSKLKLSDITAIATTTQPGNEGGLKIGLHFGKNLALKANKPFIPIHHMEAHALTARMVKKIELPFLVLLISGGHSLLAIAQDIDKYLLLSQTIDKAPGEAFDKAARRLRLKEVKELENLSGGKAIEVCAKGGNHEAYPCVVHFRGQMFSFGGLETNIVKQFLKWEKSPDYKSNEITPTIRDMCASFQYNIAKHIQKRTLKCMGYIRENGLLPLNSTMVMSGGVACNKMIREAMQAACTYDDYNLVVPPPKLCTDNGVMVAWNGVERWKAQKGIFYSPDDINEITVSNKSPLGPDLFAEMNYASFNKIKFRPFKID